MSARANHLSIAAVLLAFAGLAAWLSWELNVWQDEIYTLDTTGAGPWRAAQRAMSFELQPPLYFTALAVWREANVSLFWSRAFSVVAVAAAIALWVDAARRLAPEAPSWAVLALAVTSYPLLWAASEARCYGLVVLLGSAIVWTWQRGFLADPPSRGAQAGLVLAGVAGLYTQYYLGFVLAACGLGLIVTRDWRGVAHYLGAMLLVAVAFLPLAPLLRGQVEGHDALSAPGDRAGVVTAARETYWRLQDYVLPLGGDASAASVAARDWITRIALLAGVALAVRYRNRLPLPLFGLLLGLAGAFLALRMIVGPDFFVSRYTLALLLPAQLAVLCLLALPRKPALMAVGAGLLALIGVTHSYQQFAPLAKQGDWRRVAAFIEGSDAAAPVFVFANVGQAPLERYYHGTAPVSPLPAPLSLETYDPRLSALDSAEATAQRIEASTREGDRFWVVVAHAGAFQGVDKHPERLEAALAGQRLIEQREFVGATVRLFQRSHASEPGART